MIFSFNLSDNCDIRCIGCHWFSSEVNIKNAQPYEAYVEFIKKNNIKHVRFTGGEPLLYKDINKLIQSIKTSTKIEIFTNGNFIQELDLSARSINPSGSNIDLYVSVNRPIDNAFIKNVLKIYPRAKFISFKDNARCISIKDQLSESLSYIDIVGYEVLCRSKMIRFGTDGFSYFCEKGLRSKNELLRSGFSIYEEFKIKEVFKTCTVDHDCLSCFVGEQIYTLK